PLDLHPFPTRRSSDLFAGYPPGTTADALSTGVWLSTSVPGSGSCSLTAGANFWIVYAAQSCLPPSAEKYVPAPFTMSQQSVYERSEEHTSELQSLRQP